MSIQSISSTITRLNKEFADITHRMSLEQKKIADTNAKLVQMQKSITNNISPSSLSSKLSEISRKEQELSRYQIKVAELQKKKTEIHNKLLKENQNLAKAEELERKKLEALVKK